MGREARMVPKDWQHPRNERGYIPMHEGYADAVVEWNEKVAAEGLQAAIDYFGGAPDVHRYMPEWAPGEADHLMMYENVTEGTPISPAFKTPEELARWLADNKASAFGDTTATYEQWLSTIRRGWAPSAVASGGVVKSGVESL